jgi:hypothetical protein
MNLNNGGKLAPAGGARKPIGVVHKSPRASATLSLVSEITHSRARAFPEMM